VRKKRSHRKSSEKEKLTCCCKKGCNKAGQSTEGTRKRERPKKKGMEKGGESDGREHEITKNEDGKTEHDLETSLTDGESYRRLNKKRKKLTLESYQGRESGDGLELRQQACSGGRCQAPGEKCQTQGVKSVEGNEMQEPERGKKLWASGYREKKETCRKRKVKNGTGARVLGTEKTKQSGKKKKKSAEKQLDRKKEVGKKIPAAR